MFDQTMLETTTAPQTGAGLAELTLVTGTTILTALGERRVEDLKPGDRVITRDCGMSQLREVRRKNTARQTIMIKADAFGPAYPERDTVVPVDTFIQFRDARTAPARGKPAGTIAAQDLLDHAKVNQVDAPQDTCITLCFDRRHVIYADGLEICARLG